MNLCVPIIKAMFLKQDYYGVGSWWGWYLFRWNKYTHQCVGFKFPCVPWGIRFWLDVWPKKARQ